MNVLVSDTSANYDNWVIVRSLKDVLDIVGNVDNLVYHKSREKSEEKIRYLNEIFKSKTNCKIVYVCSKKNVDSAVKMLVTGGLSGKYVDDEFFLESGKELNTLISDLSVISESSELSSVSVLKDFFNRYMSDGDKGISKGYLQVVKNAAIKMIDEYHLKNLEILEMSESAAEIFSNSVELVAQLKETQQSLEKSINELRVREKEIQEVVPQKSRVVGSSIIYFPRITYAKNRNIIRIKDIGRCTYLVSFIFGFREYLEKIKNVRPKLIIIDGIGKLNESVYKEYSWVTSENKNDSRNYYDKVVFTNCPTSFVVGKLIEDSDYDTFIILDRSNNYKEHIINCRGNELYAVTGSHIAKSLNLPVGRCISVTTDIGKSLLTIPYFEDYPDRDDQRINKYLKDCLVQYELLFRSK